MKIADLKNFDATEYLDNPEALAEYLTVVIEENDPAALAQALGTVARARGMTDIANASGIIREALYKALRPNAQPRFDTIYRVCTALGVRLVAKADLTWIIEKIINAKSKPAQSHSMTSCPASPHFYPPAGTC